MEVEAGITWPDVIRGYLALQRGPGPAFGIRQKQTGADRLTLGGAVAANIHGRGLTAQPFVADIEGLEVVTPAGEVVRCSRDGTSRAVPARRRRIWVVRRRHRGDTAPRAARESGTPRRATRHR